LENGETYTVSVRAVNAKGSGANSEPVTATLVQQKISIPTPDNDTVELNITSESGGRLGTNCTISSWELVPAPVLTDNVSLAHPNMLNFTLSHCEPGETVGVTIRLKQDPPEDSVAYKYKDGEWRVIEGATITGRFIRYNLKDNGVLDADGELGELSDPLAVAVPSGKPDAPYNLSGTAGDGSVTISFTPGSDHDNAITNYLYSTNGVDYIALDPADDSTPVTITGLTNGEGVSITLKARNSVGDSPPSAEAVFVVPGGTTIPVLIPYWVLGLLAGLVGWMGYRKLRAHQLS
jgi:hypothetical protein